MQAEATRVTAWAQHGTTPLSRLTNLGRSVCARITQERIEDGALGPGAEGALLQLAAHVLSIADDHKAIGSTHGVTRPAVRFASAFHVDSVVPAATLEEEGDGLLA